MYPLIEMSLWIEALGTAIASSFSKEATPSSPRAAAEQKLVTVVCNTVNKPYLVHHCFATLSFLQLVDSIQDLSYK